MLWVYILLTALLACIIIGIALLVSSYWNKVAVQSEESRLVYSGDQPHVVQKQPRYVIPELRPDVNANSGVDGRGLRMEDENRRDMSKNII